MSHASPERASGPEPRLSVVVTVVDGGAALRRFLAALLAQRDAPAVEILLPYDSTFAEAEDLRREFPQLLQVDLGSVRTAHPLTTGAGRHELYDRRRAAALARARGSLVAILEDRAPPRPDWASAMIRLHARMPHAVIGGAIECVSADTLNWAFWACDFSRYAPPFTAGPRQWVSDVNVCYKRRALEATRDVWDGRFNEAKVHWSLAAMGETLFLSPEPVVEYRTGYGSLREVIPERFGWGRLFGSVRSSRSGVAGRLAFAVLAPVIPAVLLLRHGRTHLRRGDFRRFVRAAPFMMVMLCSWIAGEAWGVVTGRP